MTTRYSGRFDWLVTSPGSVRNRGRSKDLLEKSNGSPESRPTPAETLERLLDTHNWLRVRKDA
jgi:hypothetical protein